jgi:hypothetical protein
MQVRRLVTAKASAMHTTKARSAPTKHLPFGQRDPEVLLDIAHSLFFISEIRQCGWSYVSKADKVSRLHHTSPAFDRPPHSPTTSSISSALNLTETGKNQDHDQHYTSRLVMEARRKREASTPERRWTSITPRQEKRAERRIRGQQISSTTSSQPLEEHVGPVKQSIALAEMQKARSSSRGGMGIKWRSEVPTLFRDPRGRMAVRGRRPTPRYRGGITKAEGPSRSSAGGSEPDPRTAKFWVRIASFAVEMSRKWPSVLAYRPPPQACELDRRRDSSQRRRVGRAGIIFRAAAEVDICGEKKLEKENPTICRLIDSSAGHPRPVHTCQITTRLTVLR